MDTPNKNAPMLPEENSSQSPPKLEELIAQGEQKIKEMGENNAPQVAESEKNVVSSASKVFSEENKQFAEDTNSSLRGEIITNKENTQNQSRKKGYQLIQKLQQKKEQLVGVVLRLLGKPLKRSSLDTDESGNVFTKMFVPEEQQKQGNAKTTAEEVLIQNIIAQTRQNREKKDLQKETGGPQKILDLKNQQDIKKLLNKEEQEQQKAEEILQISKIFAGVSLLVPIISFLVSSLLLSTEGFFSTVIESKNYGMTLLHKNETLAEIKQDIVQKKKEIAVITEQITNIQDNKVLATIVNNRIDWGSVFDSIEKVTDEAFENVNDIAQYVVYNSYKGVGKEKKIHITGSVEFPGGKSFAGAINLKDALNESSHFEGVTMTKFIKTKKLSSGSYVTPFSFEFKYIKDPANPLAEVMKAVAGEEQP